MEGPSERKLIGAVCRGDERAVLNMSRYMELRPTLYIHALSRFRYNIVELLIKKGVSFYDVKCHHYAEFGFGLLNPSEIGGSLLPKCCMCFLYRNVKDEITTMITQSYEKVLLKELWNCKTSNFFTLPEELVYEILHFCI